MRLMVLGALGCSATESGETADAAIDAGTPPPGNAPCVRSEDCAADGSVLVCDIARGTCVTPCTIARELCDSHRHCDAVTKTCIPGCSSDEGCLATADAAARAGRCDLRTHACVECLDDVDCEDGSLCAEGHCQRGCTGAHPCSRSELCCSGACVDPQASEEHCGACGHSCTAEHGTATCIDGTCALTSCASGYADCDRDVRNGCEVNTSADLHHCGACGVECGTVARGDVACTSGVCRIGTCYGVFRDCDGKLENGCEANIATDMANCGGCLHGCTPSTNACVEGECTAATCPNGLRDCDGDLAHTCETDITSNAANCGSCGFSCVIPNGTGRCAASRCAVATCSPSFADCDGDAQNGCEVDIANDPRNCGACGSTCTGASCGNALVATMDTFPSGWAFNGNAFYDVSTGSAVLTAAEGQTSTVLYATPIAIDAFDLTFDFRIGGGGGTGADGLGFILETNGSSAVGAGGRGIGMVGLSGYGIEFDTFPDLSNIGPCEPQTEHVAIDDLFHSTTPDVYCQQMPNERVTSASLPLVLRNSGWHAAHVHWSGQVVRVSIDGATVIPSYAISGFVPGTRYYAGFSAASGILRDRHEVRNVRFDFAAVRCL